MVPEIRSKRRRENQIRRQTRARWRSGGAAVACSSFVKWGTFGGTRRDLHSANASSHDTRCHADTPPQASRHATTPRLRKCCGARGTPGDKPSGFSNGINENNIISSPHFRLGLYFSPFHPRIHRSALPARWGRCLSGLLSTQAVSTGVRRKWIPPGGGIKQPGMPVWRNSGSFFPQGDLGRKQRIWSCG